MSVKVLEHWESGGHRALLFAQTQQMLDILEKAVQVSHPGRLTVQCTAVEAISGEVASRGML